MALLIMNHMRATCLLPWTKQAEGNFLEVKAAAFFSKRQGFYETTNFFESGRCQFADDYFTGKAGGKAGAIFFALSRLFQK